MPNMNIPDDTFWVICLICIMSVFCMLIWGGLFWFYSSVQMATETASARSTSLKITSLGSMKSMVTVSHRVSRKPITSSTFNKIIKRPQSLLNQLSFTKKNKNTSPDSVVKKTPEKPTTAVVPDGKAVGRSKQAEESIKSAKKRPSPIQPTKRTVTPTPRTTTSMVTTKLTTMMTKADAKVNKITGKNKDATITAATTTTTSDQVSNQEKLVK